MALRIVQVVTWIRRTHAGPDRFLIVAIATNVCYNIRRPGSAGQRPEGGNAYLPSRFISVTVWGRRVTDFSVELDLTARAIEIGLGLPSWIKESDDASSTGRLARRLARSQRDFEQGMANWRATQRLARPATSGPSQSEPGAERHFWRKFLNFLKPFARNGLPLITPQNVASSKSSF